MAASGGGRAGEAKVHVTSQRERSDGQTTISRIRSRITISRLRALHCASELQHMRECRREDKTANTVQY